MRQRPFIFSVRDALRGIRNVVLSERNAQTHLGFAAIALALGLCFRISRFEWIAVLLCISIVLALEAMNTALERLCDRVSPEHDSLIGQAKDAAAGAVLCAALGASLVGLLVFVPYLL